MRNRTRYLLVIAAAVVVAVVMVWVVTRAPKLEVAHLHPGESVTLRSGLTLTMPAGCPGVLSRWRSPGIEPTGLADDLVVSGQVGHGVATAVSVFWEPSSESLAMVRRGTRLVCASGDGSVQVRWAHPHPGIFNVFVLTALRDKRPGVVQLMAGEAKDRASAYRVASEIWARFRVTGVTLPPPPA